MNNSMIVVAAFQDKETGKRYNVGESFTAQNEERQRVLERGGFIAAENTEAAKIAINEASIESNSQKITQAAEAKTVVNGKVVSLEQAKQAIAESEARNTQTGIQSHHDNSTEAVPSGQFAQQQTKATQYQEQTIRNANVQSGGEHMQQSMNQTQQQSTPSESANAAQTQQEMSQAAQAAQAQQNQQNQASQTQTRKASVKKD